LIDQKIKDLKSNQNLGRSLNQYFWRKISSGLTEYIDANLYENHEVIEISNPETPNFIHHVVQQTRPETGSEKTQIKKFD